MASQGSLEKAHEELDRQLSDLMDSADADEQSRQTESGCRSATATLSADEDAKGENVTVMVRCRPRLANETTQGSGDATDAILADEDNKCVQVARDGRQFCFDQVFGERANNEHVYMKSARRLVEFAFRGFNCTIFLYGQTGTGKTYTHSSLTLSSFEHLFSLIQASDKKSKFLIRASYYELYNEEIRDLLSSDTVGGQQRANSRKRGGRSSSSRKALELRESKERGVYIKDLTNFLVNNLNELVKLKRLGDRRRATAATKMNEHSSRSHSIFSITIEQTSSQLGNTEPRGQPQKRAAAQTIHQSSLRLGRLHLIDLAGSERQSKSGSSGAELKEASQINLSLTCLSLVIRALTDSRKQSTDGQAASLKKQAAHIPYRNSKLTRLLSSSLGGNSKTLLMACISPLESSLDETLSTLRFASRTKQIKNRAIINEDPKDALLRKYKRQLNELRQILSERERATQQAANLTKGPTNSAGLPLPTSGLTKTMDNDKAGQQEELDGQQEQLMKQLELLKAKIMSGGENLIDKVELHERLLEAKRLELEERQREEEKLRSELLERDRKIKSVSKSRGSLEQQREHLDERLKRAMRLFKRSKFEAKDLTSEHEQLKEQLLHTIRLTSKEIKYIDCIIDDFIPRDLLDLINAYAQYDDESEEWQIKYIALSGNNMEQTRRLTANLDRTSEVIGGLSSASSLAASDRPEPFLK